METLGQVARTLKRMYNSNSPNLLLLFVSRYMNMVNLPPEDNSYSVNITCPPHKFGYSKERQHCPLSTFNQLIYH